MDTKTNRVSATSPQTFELTERHAAGFSLIELLMALTISAILLGIATPSFAALFSKTQMEIAVEDLYGDIQHGRTAAIREGARVQMCKSSDGEFCGEEAFWNDGWILFYDYNTNRTRDENEPVLRVRKFSKDAVAINFGRWQRMYMKPDGSVWPNGTFRLCDQAENVEPQSIVVYRTGRIRRSDTLPSGGPIYCG